MRRIEFIQDDTWSEAPAESNLISFLLNVPFVFHQGFIPPREALNSFLLRGTWGGGMGPGARWEPFAITEEEYNDLVGDLFSTSVNELQDKYDLRWPLRFGEFKVDPGLDLIPDFWDWMAAINERYGEPNKST